MNTHQVARQFEEAAYHPEYKLYSVIYHSQELNSFVASKAHPAETLRYHVLTWLIGCCSGYGHPALLR